MPDENVTPPVTPTPPTNSQTPAQTPPKTDAPVPDANKPAPTDTAAPGEKKDDASGDTLLGSEDDKGDAKPDDNKSSEPAKGVVPEKYDVKVPEGMNVDQKMLEAVTPVFKELGITAEGAQKLVDAYAPIVQKQIKEQHDTMMKGFTDQVESWGKQTKEMLGAEPQKALAPAAKFISTFAGAEAKEFRQLLNQTGLGNHPLMVKVLIAAGKALSQDSFVDGGSGPATDNSQEATIRKHYPSMSK